MLSTAEHTLGSIEEDSFWLEENSQVTLSEESFRRRLNRRTRVIDELRRAYLRDVVAVHRAINELDAPTQERLKSIIGTDTFVDLSAPLKLFSPAETILEVKPCETCGGTMELTYQYSSEIQKLNEQIERMKQKQLTMAQEFAKTRGDLFAARETIEQMKHNHAAEQQVFLEQVTTLRNQLNTLTTTSAEMKTVNQKLKGENTHYRVSLEHQTALITELHKKIEQYRANDASQRRLLSESEDLFDDYQAACAEVNRLRTENEQLQQQVTTLKDMVEPLQSNYDTLQEQISLLFDAAGLRGRSAEELRRMQNDLYQARLRAKTKQREYDVLEKRIAEREKQQRQQQSEKLSVADPSGHDPSIAERWQERRTSFQQQLLHRVSTRNLQREIANSSEGSTPDKQQSSAKLSLPEVVARQTTQPQQQQQDKTERRQHAEEEK